MRVLVVTGASGGHIFPALSFLESFKESDSGSECLLILPERGGVKKIENSVFKINYVIFGQLSLKLDLKSFKNLFYFVKGSLKSIGILVKFKPDLVAGFGSLISVPVIIGAWFLRIVTLIHEQNVLPGKANRFLAFFADKIAVSFEESKNYFNGFERKVVITGNPIRKSLKVVDKKEALNYFDFDPGKFTILVSGGSQGSRKINAQFIAALSLLEDKTKIQVIHLCGQSDYATLNQAYKKLGIKAALYSFFDAMQFAYGAADLAISRAGATTVSELIFFKLPSILIPYPYAYKHQYKNASILAGLGTSIIINDEDLEEKGLELLINDFRDNPEKLADLRLNYNKINQSPDAAGELVKMALKL